MVISQICFSFSISFHINHVKVSFCKSFLVKLFLKFFCVLLICPVPCNFSYCFICLVNFPKVNRFRLKLFRHLSFIRLKLIWHLSFIFGCLPTGSFGLRITLFICLLWRILNWCCCQVWGFLKSWIRIFHISFKSTSIHHVCQSWVLYSWICKVCFWFNWWSPATNSW
jgi:hypothetical protein